MGTLVATVAACVQMVACVLPESPMRFAKRLAGVRPEANFAFTPSTSRIGRRCDDRFVQAVKTYARAR